MKLAEELAGNIRNIIKDLAKNYIDIILKTVNENKNDLTMWPLSFQYGDVITDNDRIINSIIEQLENDFGFIIVERERCLVIDLPVEVEEIEEEAPKENKKLDEIIMTAEMAVKMTEEKKDVYTKEFYNFINKKILSAVNMSPPKNCAEFDAKDPMINGDGKVFKRIYNKLKSLNYKFDDVDFSKDRDGKIIFDKVKVLKVRW